MSDIWPDPSSTSIYFMRASSEGSGENAWMISTIELAPMFRFTTGVPKYVQVTDNYASVNIVFRLQYGLRYRKPS